MITLLNTSVITCYGVFVYKPIPLEIAQDYVNLASGIQSAIGHQATAEILSELLERPVEMNRINYVQQIDEDAIVFKLKSRVEEGKILSREEIEAIGYEFGLLRRVA